MNLPHAGGVVDVYPVSPYQSAVLLGGAEPAVRVTADLGVADLAAVAARLDEVVAVSPALRTRITAGPIQVVDAGGPAGVRSALRHLPNRHVELTLDLADPVLDPVGAAALVARLTDPCHGGTIPVDPARELLAASALAPSSEAWAVHADRLGGFALPAPEPATPTSAQAALMPADARSLRAADDPRLLALTAYLSAVGRIAGSAVSGAWVVLDGRAPAGLDPDAIGELRLLLPVTLDRLARNGSVVIDRVAQALRAPFPLGAPAPAHGLVDMPVFAYRAGAPSAGMRYRDRAPGGCAVTVTERPDGGLDITVRRGAGGADVVLAAYLDALAEIVSVRLVDRRSADRAPAPEPLDGEPGTVVELVRATVSRVPDAVAVVDGERVLRYRDLDDRSAEVAARLMAGGVRPGQTVGVCLPRSAELVTAVLGVLRAGAAFLALDVDSPAHRAIDALADARATALVESAGETRFPDFAGVRIDLSSPVPAPTSVPTAALATPSPAYVLFTSGSTGRPKGVVVPHGALANLARWTASGLGIGAGDRVAQRTPVAFGAGVWELLVPLTCGAAVVVVPSEANQDVALMESALADGAVTVVQLVPRLLSAQLEAGTFRRCPALRMVVSGGEALPRKLTGEFARQSNAELINVYGPTECAVDVTWAVSGPDVTGATVPIGSPVPGVRATVLDELGQQVDTGAAGELYLGGVQLALGYAHDPARTAERFVPDPEVQGGRRYRTGDRVRRGPGGLLEYLGRVDRLVKVRGVRAEPGEIESTLAAHPGIRAAAVRADRTGFGEAELTAFFTGTTDVTSVREFLRGRLSDQMIPAKLVPLAVLPLQPNGKVDHHKLPSSGAAGPVYRPPIGLIEHQIADGWARVLGVDAVGRADDLDCLGRDRIFAVAFVALVERELDWTVPVSDALSASTVADMAAVLSASGTPAAE